MAENDNISIQQNDAKDRRICNRIIIAVLVIQILTLLAVAILTLAVVAKIATENTVCLNNAPFALESTVPNYTNVNCTCPGILPLLEIAKNESYKSDLLYNIIGSLANIKQTSTTTSGDVNDMLLAVENILDIQNKTFILNHIQKASCKDVKSVYPSSSSGYYHLNGQTVYCNMDSLCGSGGGWTRLAYLDMTDATQSCPSGFRLYTSGNVRACGRPSSGGASCSPSVKFGTNGISYSAICGRVTGYQYESTDGIGNTNNINSHYVDGVSITRGFPRQHVWTFIAGMSDTYSNSYSTRLSNCPCNDPPPVPGSQPIPSFVGSNYFCESGNHGSDWSNNVLYTGDPLWDGQGCGPIETPCCAAPGLPWFHRDYGNTTTTDYIELRICGDEANSNEDIPVSYYEIFVK